MSRQQRAGSCSGHIIVAVAQVIFICVATIVLGSSSSAATPTGLGSIRAELLHREHPLSPQRSPDDMDQYEKSRNTVERSEARSRSLLQRRLVGGHPARGSTFETSVEWGPDAGEYFMMISLGTPAQNFIAIADTGSDLTWLQCTPFEFNLSAPAFSPSLSSTYSPLSCSSPGCQSYLSGPHNDLLDPNSTASCDSSASCPYAYTYGTGFTIGNLSSESITLSSTKGQNLTVLNFWFGCSHNSSDDFEPADGLVGLARGPISFPTQLGHDFEDKFAYCLVNKSLTTAESSLLVFGHDAVNAPIYEKLRYTPILSDANFSSFYYVGLESISVDGVALNFTAEDVAIDSEGNGGTIFDSGTTITSLTPLIYSPLLEAVNARVPESYQFINISALTGLELCYNVTGRDSGLSSVFPSISFKFAKAGPWDLPFENSWEVFEGLVACLAFTEGETGAQNIFGNTQQQDFYVQYDRVHHKIGFAPTDCGSVAP